MAINVFEGARRVALLAAGIWTAACGYILVFDAPDHVSVEMVIQRPFSTAVRGSCGDDYANTVRKYKTMSVKDGVVARITLCFVPQDFDGRQLIPYRVDEKGLLWGSTAYSTPVTEYTDRVANSFRLTAADEEWVASQLWPQRWQRFIGIARNWGLGLLALYILTKVIGWVVRGFSGIPSGRDSRPSEQ